MSQTDSPWYRDGLAFECTRCGSCCTGAPGYVWVGPVEMARLAEHRGEAIDDFTGRFVRQVEERYSLIERPNGDCVFWDRDRGCTVYPARPEQCRTWPFWPENLAARSDWKRIARSCPGAGRGRVYTLDEIEAAVVRTPQ